MHARILQSPQRAAPWLAVCRPHLAHLQYCPGTCLPPPHALVLRGVDPCVISGPCYSLRYLPHLPPSAAAATAAPTTAPTTSAAAAATPPRAVCLKQLLRLLHPQGPAVGKHGRHVPPQVRARLAALVLLLPRAAHGEGHAVGRAGAVRLYGVRGRTWYVGAAGKAAGVGRWSECRYWLANVS